MRGREVSAEVRRERKYNSRFQTAAIAVIGVDHRPRLHLALVN